MARFDWDRELREARKRKHGAIPVGADPSALSADDEREVNALLEPLGTVFAAFRGMSRTQREQRRTEFDFRLRKLCNEAVEKAAVLPNLATGQAVDGHAKLLIENFRRSRYD
jgi:hypothetical protein